MRKFLGFILIVIGLTNVLAVYFKWRWFRELPRVSLRYQLIGNKADIDWYIMGIAFIAIGVWAIAN